MESVTKKNAQFAQRTGAAGDEDKWSQLFNVAQHKGSDECRECGTEQK